MASDATEVQFHVGRVGPLRVGLLVDSRTQPAWGEWALCKTVELGADEFGLPVDDDRNRLLADTGLDFENVTGVLTLRLAAEHDWTSVFGGMVGLIREACADADHRSSARLLSASHRSRR